MSALHELLTYVLGYDPDVVRREQEDQLRGELEENKKTHKKYRQTLEEDPLRKLLHYTRRQRNGSNNDDGSAG